VKVKLHRLKEISFSLLGEGCNLVLGKERCSDSKKFHKAYLGKPKLDF